MTKNQMGLILGFFLTSVHVVWSLAVAIIPSGLEQFINWVFTLHHLGLPIAITPFVFSDAIVLVILTFVIGYILYLWLGFWFSDEFSPKVILS